MENRLFIILPTYNGEKYIAQQLDSLQRQTFNNWQLLIRDDGSTDQTLAIVKKYLCNDSRITLIEDIHNNLGACAGFSLLMTTALELGAGYVAFCDQDDIWLPEKLEITLNRIQMLENNNGFDTPLLVHTDLQIVDETLETISHSFIEFENINDPAAPQLNRLLVQNYVVGCTILCNRALLQMASPVPSAVRMHDWWLAAFAVAAGQLSFIAEPTIKYRQHSNNTLGVGGFSQIYNPFSKAWRRRLLKRPMLQKATTVLANALFERLKDKPSTNVIKELTECHECLNDSFGLRRVFRAYKVGLSGQNWVSTIIFYILLLSRKFQ
jgi:glycosyltransferase involved in cell wall biosynthesis